MELRQSVAGCVLLLAASAALAAEQGFYFGLLGGRAEYEFEAPRLVAGLFVPPGGSRIVLPPFESLVTTVPDVAFSAGSALRPASFWSPDDDDKDTAWGIVAGYRIVRYAAVELNYLNLGTLKATDTLFLPPIPGGGTIPLNRELETTGPSVSGLGILPVSDAWEIYLRAGVMFADMEFTTSVNGGSSSVTFGSETAVWGAGVALAQRSIDLIVG